MTTHRFSFQNKSGQLFPAYGCGRLKSILSTDTASTNPVYELVKPDGEEGLYVVNGPSNVENNGFGVAVGLQDAVLVLVDDGSTTGAPVFGSICGPANSRWAATTGGNGLRATGAMSNRIMSVTSHAAGGGADIIQFRPTDVCEGIGFSCDCVTAVVATSSCGSGLSPGDEVQVWDQSGGWFKMPEELLFNSIGWAHKVKVTEEEQYSLPFPIGDCRWVVLNMDCVEQGAY